MSKKGTINKAVASEELERYFDLQEELLAVDVVDVIREFEDYYDVKLLGEAFSTFEMLLSLVKDASSKVRGIPELIEATGDPDIEEKLDAFEEQDDIVSASETEPDEDCLCPTSWERKYARRKRRISEVKARTQAIQLGSAAIYSEDGKLLRSKGIILKKLDTAAREGRKYVRNETARRIYMHAKHLIKLAEKYKDYTILYRGRYFKDTSKDIQLPDVLEETDTAEELYPSEKDNVPMSIRRDKHHVNALHSCKKHMGKDNMLPISSCCKIPVITISTYCGIPNISISFSSRGFF